MSLVQMAICEMAVASILCTPSRMRCNFAARQCHCREEPQPVKHGLSLDRRCGGAEHRRARLSSVDPASPSITYLVTTASLLRLCGRGARTPARCWWGGVRGVRCAHHEHPSQHPWRSPVSGVLLCDQVPWNVLTTPYSYAAMAFDVGHGETLLRDGTRATVRERCLRQRVVRGNIVHKSQG